MMAEEARAGQPASQIVATLERMVELAYVRESRNIPVQDLPSPALGSAWSSLDRLIGLAGAALFLPGEGAPAARYEAAAFDWFRAQPPSGQAAILRAVQATPPANPDATAGFGFGNSVSVVRASSSA